MKNKNKPIEYYLEIIDEVEKVRTRNNVNWMDILRLAIQYAPVQTKKLISKINEDDNKISKLFSKLSQ